MYVLFCFLFLFFCFAVETASWEKRLRSRLNANIHSFIHSSIHPFIQLIIDYLNEQMNEYKLTGYDFEQTNERFSSWLVK